MPSNKRTMSKSQKKLICSSTVFPIEEIVVEIYDHFSGYLLLIFTISQPLLTNYFKTIRLVPFSRNPVMKTRNLEGGLNILFRVITKALMPTYLTVYRCQLIVGIVTVIPIIGQITLTENQTTTIKMALAGRP